MFTHELTNVDCDPCVSSALDSSSKRVFSSVCVSVNRSVVERLRPQFFTDFHKILHAAQTCRRFHAYCLLDKQEVHVV